MVPLHSLFEATELRKPSTPEVLARAEQNFGFALPSQLLSLYSQSNGVLGNWTVTIFQAESLFERNETYGVVECLPNLLYVGNDNGNRGLFIPKASSQSTVFECDLGDQSVEGLVLLASSLSEWFEQGCPWSDGDLGAPRESDET